MLKKKIIRLATGSNSDRDQGFSLLESAVALVTLAICLAYAMPMFLYAKINNTKSEIRTGALTVAQRVFDDVRSKSITSLPNNTPTSISVAANLANAMGRQYQARIVYCENISTNTTVCNNEYRTFRVEVSYNGTKVYDLEGTYTSFK